MDRCAIHGAVHSDADYQYSKTFSVSYLNANVSTSVFTSCSVVRFD
jgi:hypothetical protein